MRELGVAEQRHWLKSGMSARRAGRHISRDRCTSPVRQVPRERDRSVARCEQPPDAAELERQQSVQHGLLVRVVASCHASHEGVRAIVRQARVIPTLTDATLADVSSRGDAVAVAVSFFDTRRPAQRPSRTHRETDLRREKGETDYINGAAPGWLVNWVRTTLVVRTAADHDERHARRGRLRQLNRGPKGAIAPDRHRPELHRANPAEQRQCQAVLLTRAITGVTAKWPARYSYLAADPRLLWAQVQRRRKACRPRIAATSESSGHQQGHRHSQQHALAHEPHLATIAQIGRL
jgi:hypothetical protein